MKFLPFFDKKIVLSHVKSQRISRIFSISRNRLQSLFSDYR